jgi:hypothetical protein
MVDEPLHSASRTILIIQKVVMRWPVTASMRTAATSFSIGHCVCGRWISTGQPGRWSLLRELEDALELIGGVLVNVRFVAIQEIPELTRLATEGDVAAYSEQRVPPPARHQVRLELKETRDKMLTIVERRLPFDSPGLVDPAIWTWAPVTQLWWSGDHLCHLDTGRVVDVDRVPAPLRATS